MHTPDDRTVGDTAGPGPREGLVLAPGSRVGRYVIEQHVGAGGMGIVYAAHDPELDRKVAVKLLHVGPEPETSKASAGRTRLVREAQAMARLSHRNVVTVHDVGEHQGHVFVAMEFVEGRTLSQWARERRPSVREVVHVFVEAGRGLAAAHAAGLVHRDFKPDNVMVVVDRHEVVERVLVMDFGLARPSAVGDPLVVREPTMGDAIAQDPGITRTGGMLGTPAYMAPEQHLGQAIDHRSDQFSYCVSLFEILFGVRPFAGDSPAAVAVAAIEGQVRTLPAGVRVPPWLRRAVMRGISPDPNDRWPSMDALVAELARDRGGLRRAALVGGVVAVAGAIWLVGRPTEDAGVDACADAGEGIAAVWDDAARERVRVAFEATDVHYAARTWPLVQPHLDAYATAWADARTETCRVAASEPVGTNALRIACLDARAHHFAALVEVLAQADAAVVEHAVQSVERLPPLEQCNDLAWLTAQVKPPEDESQRTAVDELRRELSAIEVSFDTGRYAPARDRATAALERARAIGYAPVVAEAAQMLGTIQIELAALDAAVAALEDAYLVAGGCGHDRIAALAAIDLVDAWGVAKAETAKGREWLKHARMQVERLARSDAAREKLLAVQAMLEWTEGNAAAAVGSAEQSLSLAIARTGEDSGEVGRMLGSLGLYENAAGRPEIAKLHLQRGVELLESELGPDHPLVSNVLGNLGIARNDSGDPQGALAAYRRALEIRERALGPTHPSVGGAVENIAIVLAEQARNEEALPMFQRALAIRESTLGPEHPRVASSHMNYGISLGLAGRNVESIEHLQRALEITRKAHGEDHPTLGMIHFELGNRERERGDLDAALQHHQRAHDVLAKAIGERHPHMVSVLGTLGATHARRGEDDRALALFEQAVALGLEVQVRPDELAQVKAELAAVLWRKRPHERARAMQLAEQALAALPVGSSNRREVETWLAAHRR